MRNTQIPFLAGVVLIGCLGLGGGCQLTESKTSLTHAPLTGRLVYVVSDDVREYDLASGERRVPFRYDAFLYPPITDVDETRFIVNTLRTDMLLVGMDGHAHVLGKGHHQEFFPAHGKLLYTDVPPGQSYAQLHEATLRENRLESPRVVGGGPIDSTLYGRSILTISDDEALIRRHDGSYTNKRYSIYNLRTGVFTDLDVPTRTCVAAAWRSRTQELICLDPSAQKPGQYALVSLDGRRRTPVPGLTRLIVSVYVPQGDYVLAGKGRWSWRYGEQIDLYSYHFSTGGVQRIAKKVPVGGSSSFWLPPRSAAE